MKGNTKKILFILKLSDLAAAAAAAAEAAIVFNPTQRYHLKLTKSKQKD